jgi:hypothetical protein
MKETVWTPSSIAIAERADHLLALMLADPGELVSVPLGRTVAHRIGRELIAAAALEPAEIARMHEADAQPDTVLL